MMDPFEKAEMRRLEMRHTLNRIPDWAKAEHLEVTVPQAELWRFSSPACCPAAAVLRRLLRHLFR